MKLKLLLPVTLLTCISLSAYAFYPVTLDYGIYNGVPATQHFTSVTASVSTTPPHNTLSYSKRDTSTLDALNLHLIYPHTEPEGTNIVLTQLPQTRQLTFSPEYQVTQVSGKIYVNVNAQFYQTGGTSNTVTFSIPVTIDSQGEIEAMPRSANYTDPNHPNAWCYYIIFSKSGENEAGLNITCGVG